MKNRKSRGDLRRAQGANGATGTAKSGEADPLHSPVTAIPPADIPQPSVENMRERYGFRPGYDLLGRLEDVHAWAALAVGAERHRPRRTKSSAELQRIASLAAELENALKGLHVDLQLRIQLAWRQPKTKASWRCRMVDDARSLKLTATAADRRHPPPANETKRKEEAINQLLRLLVDAYEDGTGQPAKAPWRNSRVDGWQSTDVFEFILECLKWMPTVRPYSDGAIAERLGGKEGILACRENPRRMSGKTSASDP